MNKRYEYKVEWVRGTVTREDNDKYEVRLQKTLTYMGDQGWRMIHLTPCNDGAELIFERPVSKVVMRSASELLDANELERLSA